MSDLTDATGITDEVTATLVKGPDPAVWGVDADRPAFDVHAPPVLGPVVADDGHPVLDGNGEPVVVKGPDPAVWGD